MFVFAKFAKHIIRLIIKRYKTSLKTSLFRICITAYHCSKNSDTIND